MLLTLSCLLGYEFGLFVSSKHGQRTGIFAGLCTTLLAIGPLLYCFIWVLSFLDAAN